MCFPSLAPGATQAKQVVLANRSPLPLSYHWVVEHEPTPHNMMQSYMEKWGVVGQSHSVFEVQPQFGTLPPSGTIAYSITFAPLDSALYKGVARLVSATSTSASPDPPAVSPPAWWRCLSYAISAVFARPHRPRCASAESLLASSPSV